MIHTNFQILKLYEINVYSKALGLKLKKKNISI